MSIAPATPLPALPLPAPGAALAAANLTGSPKIAEKTVELTVAAQFGNLLGADMVWFGLTQKQERQHGFDAATNLGGRAFILQFKVSATVRARGAYVGQRCFTCQHQQMQNLVTRFGALPNACFYFLPNVGRFHELVAAHGDLLTDSYLVDVASVQNPVPPTHRRNDYHYVYLDTAVPNVTITSDPFSPNRVYNAREFAKSLSRRDLEFLPRVTDLLRLAREFDREDRRLANVFYKNAALVVIPGFH